MKLWWLWTMVTLAFLLSIVAQGVWPSVLDINQSYGLPVLKEIHLSNKEDILAMIVLKPFHYLISGILFIFSLLMLSLVLKKVIYEFKVSLILKKKPYEAVAVATLAVAAYVQILLFFPALILTLSLIILLYEGSILRLNRKKDVVYVREG
ncbi:hypothetical protein [Bacillus horti]|uniref:Neutral ceramidase superfamily lipid hydrolase n=1 Tax=Caldalkalibacillus horti TaxID=77523 RepID=A0ABT9W4I2_9BACI|nr:hypothetical protein [Bacillus horti]MDQ0168159.1 putative neutral ceramidase superfamily lipid hydrolase [Bacillus horti]